MSMRNRIAAALVVLAGAASAQQPTHPYGLPVNPNVIPINFSWQQMPGAGNDIGVGGGVVWVIGTNPEVGGYGIYRWNGSMWTKIPGSAVRIDVDPKGNAWVVTSGHAIFRYDGQQFVQVPGQAATDIGIGADGSVWIIGADAVGSDHSIYRYVNNAWQKMPGAAVRIDVDFRGNAWVVNSGHQILQWTGSSWKQLPGSAVDIGIGSAANGANEAVFIVDPSGHIFRWANVNGGTWQSIPGGLSNVSVDQNGYPWGVNAGNQIWGSYKKVVMPTSFVSAGAATTFTAPDPGTNFQMTMANGGVDYNFPADQPCPTSTYTVPAGVSYVRITATGGAGMGSDAVNVLATLMAVAGVATGQGDNNTLSPGWANVSGGTGGRGAKVSGIFAVHPGQTLYVVAGLNAVSAMRSNRGGGTSGYPGGGMATRPGGGFSMVATTPPGRPLSNDPNYCFVPRESLLIIAGGGGGAGLSGTSGFGGNGGDAGMIGGNAKAGQSGAGGWSSGGGAGGGTQTAGGGVGSHPGCGSEARYDGSYLRGSDDSGGGGPGGGGYYGGGAGGGGDCFLDTGSGGGGGGSSYVNGNAASTSSAIADKYDAGVVIEPMQGQ